MDLHPRRSPPSAAGWDGDVVVRVTSPGSWALGLRVPACCASATFAVKGTPVEPLRSDGYAVLEREWASGDEVSCRFAMPPRLTEAHPRVDAARGCVAVERGPRSWTRSWTQRSRWGTAGGRNCWAGSRRSRRCEDGSGPAPLYVPFGSRAAGSRRPVRMRAIPYWTWANRGPSAIGYGCLGPACVAEREGGAARRGAAPQFSAFRPTGSWPRFS
jgi:hypothetical protein